MGLLDGDYAAFIKCPECESPNVRAQAQIGQKIFMICNVATCKYQFTTKLITHIYDSKTKKQTTNENTTSNTSSLKKLGKLSPSRKSLDRRKSLRA